MDRGGRHRVFPQCGCVCAFASDLYEQWSRHSRDIGASSLGYLFHQSCDHSCPVLPVKISCLLLWKKVLIILH